MDIELERILTSLRDDKENEFGSSAGAAAWPDSLNLKEIQLPKCPQLSPADIDRDFIKGCLERSDRENLIRDYHKNRFQARFASQIESLARLRDLVISCTEVIRGEMDRAWQHLGKTQPLVRQAYEPGGKVAWLPLEVVVASMIALISVALLGIGLNTLATYLIASGIITFIEHPGLAYLLSALNIGLTALLKIGASWCRTDHAARTYFFWLWAGGLAAGICWVVTFSSIFPDIGPEDIDSLVDSLGKESSFRDALLDGVFVGSQLLGEIFIAAALWIQLERMFSDHAPRVLFGANPEHRAYSARLARWSATLKTAQEKRALLEGRLKELGALESAIEQKAIATMEALRNLDRRQRFPVKP